MNDNLLNGIAITMASALVYIAVGLRRSAEKLPSQSLESVDSIKNEFSLVKRRNLLLKPGTYLILSIIIQTIFASTDYISFSTVRFSYVFCIVLSIFSGSFFPEYIRKSKKNTVIMPTLSAIALLIALIFAMEFTSSKTLVSFIMFNILYIMLSYSSIQLVHRFFNQSID